MFNRYLAETNKLAIENIQTLRSVDSQEYAALESVLNLRLFFRNAQVCTLLLTLPGYNLVDCLVVNSEPAAALNTSSLLCHSSCIYNTQKHRFIKNKFPTAFYAEDFERALNVKHTKYAEQDVDFSSLEMCLSAVGFKA